MRSDFPPARMAGRGTRGKGGPGFQPRWLGHFPVSLYLGPASTLSGDSSHLHKWHQYLDLPARVPSATKDKTFKSVLVLPTTSAHHQGAQI